MNTDNRKATLLSTPVEHVDITTFDARPIIDAMAKMSFTSRDLARATRIVEQMVADPDCTVILTLAGSTSAGGCMDLYTQLVKSGLVDVIVSTGASIVDMDFFEALGFKHYQGGQDVDDRELRSLYIDRIYDTYIDENELQACDAAIQEIADGLEPGAWSSRAFIREMGRWLIDNGKLDIFKAGQESGLGFSFVATMKDILEMEQLLDRDYFVEIDHPVAGKLSYPGAPIMPEDSVDAWVFKRSPLLGEHSSQALGSWLDYSETQVSGLVERGVIRQNSNNE